MGRWWSHSFFSGFPEELGGSRSVFQDRSKGFGRSAVLHGSMSALGIRTAPTLRAARRPAPPHALRAETATCATCGTPAGALPLAVLAAWIAAVNCVKEVVTMVGPICFPRFHTFSYRFHFGKTVTSLCQGIVSYSPGGSSAMRN